MGDRYCIDVWRAVEDYEGEERAFLERYIAEIYKKHPDDYWDNAALLEPFSRAEGLAHAEWNILIEEIDDRPYFLANAGLFLNKEMDQLEERYPGHPFPADYHGGMSIALSGSVPTVWHAIFDRKICREKGHVWYLPVDQLRQRVGCLGRLQRVIYELAPSSSSSPPRTHPGYDALRYALGYFDPEDYIRGLQFASLARGANSIVSLDWDAKVYYHPERDVPIFKAKNDEVSRVLELIDLQDYPAIATAISRVEYAIKCTEREAYLWAAIAIPDGSDRQAFVENCLEVPTHSLYRGLY